MQLKKASPALRILFEISEKLSAPLVWLVVGFYALYFLTSAFDFFISDGEVMYQTAREIEMRGRLDQPANPALPQIIQGKDGLFYSKYGVGQPFLAAGFFRFGKWLWFHFMPEKWDEPIGHFAVSLLPLVVTALTVGLVYLFARKLYNSKPIAIGLALLYGLGTSAWPYSHFFFSEPLFGFCTLLAAYALFQAKTARLPWQIYGWLIGGGLVFGYAILTRVSGVALIPAYLFYLWLIAGGSHGFNFKQRGFWLNPRFIKYGLAFGLAVIPSLLLTGYFNWLRFGNPLSSGYEGEGFTTPIWEGMWGLLCSTGKSVFVYSPVLVAVPFALKPFIKRARPEALFFLAVCSLTYLYYAAWWAWYGGFSWGPRFLVPVLPFAILTLGALFENSRRWLLMIFVGLLPLSVFIQMLGVGVNFNAHLAKVTGFQPGYDSDYIWIPALSPVRGNFELFWNPSNNVIRALTLEQLGLNARVAKYFTMGAWAGLFLSLFMVSYAYVLSRRKLRTENKKAGQSKVPSHF